MFEKKIITRNALLTEMKSRPREHARKEGFKTISSDASSICHKTSSKLFFVIDILHLVHCFKICFNYMLPLPTESSVNWSNKHVFVRRKCKELSGNLRRWYLVNGHGDLFFLFYISKHCTIRQQLVKVWQKSSVKFYFGSVKSLRYRKAWSHLACRSRNIPRCLLQQATRSGRVLGGIKPWTWSKIIL